MVSRLRPLNVNVIFEDRPYPLGQTIDITVELLTNRDVNVREARLELVWEGPWPGRPGL